MTMVSTFARLFHRPKLAIWSQPILFAGCLLAAVVFSLNTGFMRISPGDVLQTLAGGGTRQQETILFFFRGPRIAMAVLVGSGLAISGVLLQGISRNGLADPGILGINAGAGVGVLALLAFYPISSTETFSAAAAVFNVPFAAFAGGLAAAAAVYLLARKKGAVSPVALVLTGVALSAGFSALMLVLSMAIHDRLYDYAVKWLAGSIASANWSGVLALAPWILVLAPLSMLWAHRLNLLAMGDGLAAGVGVGVETSKLAAIAIAVALASACVSLAGGIGFIGLMAPHIARRVVGPDHRALIPAAALTGATLMVLADTAARTIVPQVEIPVGVVVAALGSPFFISLLLRPERQIHQKG